MKFDFIAQLRVSLQVTGKRARKLKTCPFCKMPGYLYKELKHTIHFRQYETWVNRKNPQVASWCEGDTHKAYQLWAHPILSPAVHPARLSPPRRDGPAATIGRPTTVIDATPRPSSPRSAWIGPKSRRARSSDRWDDPWTEDDVPF